MARRYRTRYRRRRRQNEPDAGPRRRRRRNPRKSTRGYRKWLRHYPARRRRAAARKAWRTRRRRRGRRHNPETNPRRGTKGYRKWRRSMRRTLGKGWGRRKAKRRRKGKRRPFRLRPWERRGLIYHRRVGRGLQRGFGAAARMNPRRYRRFRRRGGFRSNPNGIVGMLGAAAVAWLAGRVVSGAIGWGVAKVPQIGTMLGRHAGPVTSVLTVLAGDQLSRPGRPLAKWRTPILIGTGLLAIDNIIRTYLLGVLPAQVKGFLGLGQIPAYWQAGASLPYQHAPIQGMGAVQYATAGMYGTGDYIEVPPGVGLAQLQEAAAGIGEYIEVPPGVGLAQLQEAAAGIGEYIEVPPGMQGIGQFAEVAPGYEGARIAAMPPGQMPVPATASPEQAAYESAHAGGEGLFEEGGIFG